jgi:hypothetical protein
MSNDALPMDDSSTLPTDHRDPVVEIVVPVEQIPANANVPASLLPKPPQVVCNLRVDELDERGNTVKYIYSCDPDYVVYYSRLERRSASANAETKASGAGKWRRRSFPSRRFSVKQTGDLPYESEGVQAQLSSDPATRQRLRRLLLPLGTERAKLQALLSDWPRRQSFDLGGCEFQAAQKCLSVRPGAFRVIRVG